MKLRLVLKVLAMVVLGVIAIVLYADLQSIHQIYRITPAMINGAPDEAKRRGLQADMEKRNAEERKLKLKVDAVLVGDLAILAAAVVWSLRTTTNKGKFGVRQN